MIVLSVIIAAGAVFALWRRAFGGWLGLSRVALLSASVGAAASIASWKYGISWEPIIVAACWAWLWADGHEFDPPGKALFYRYATPMAVCAAIIGNPWLAMIGPAIFLCYWDSWRLWPSFRYKGFLDGCYAYAELGAGFVAGAILVVAMSL